MSQQSKMDQIFTDFDNFGVVETLKFTAFQWRKNRQNSSRFDAIHGRFAIWSMIPLEKYSPIDHFILRYDEIKMASSPIVLKNDHKLGHRTELYYTIFYKNDFVRKLRFRVFQRRHFCKMTQERPVLKPLLWSFVRNWSIIRSRKSRSMSWP